MPIITAQQKEEIQNNKTILEENILNLIEEWQEVNGIDIMELSLTRTLVHVNREEIYPIRMSLYIKTSL